MLVPISERGALFRTISTMGQLSMVSIARVTAVLRRTQALPPRQKPPGAERIRFGDWTLDTGQRELIGLDGVALPLSSGEFRLLTALLARPKIVAALEGKTPLKVIHAGGKLVNIVVR